MLVLVFAVLSLIIELGLAYVPPRLFVARTLAAACAIGLLGSLSYYIIVNEPSVFTILLSILNLYRTVNLLRIMILNQCECEVLPLLYARDDISHASIYALYQWRPLYIILRYLANSCVSAIC